MTTHQPTRACPHALCRPLHAIAATAALLTASAVAPHGPWILGTLAVGALFSVGIYQLVHRQTMVDSIKEAIHQTAIITVRPGWARAAAAMDLIFTAIVLTVLATVFTNQTATSWGTPSRTILLASVAISVALTATTEVVHRQAIHIQRVRTEEPEAGQ